MRRLLILLAGLALSLSRFAAGAAELGPPRSGAAPEILLDWQGAAPEPLPRLRDARGQPVFPRELYSLHSPEDYRIARFLGCNAVIEHGDRTLALARDFGFLATTADWFTAATSTETLCAAAARYAGQPALLACNLNDEPDLRQHQAAPEALARAAAALRAALPGVQLSVTLARLQEADKSWPAYAAAVDVLRVDPYPLVEHQPLARVHETVAAARRAAAGKPVLCILQAWEWPGTPFPSARQLRGMAWQALVAGAAGLSYFDWNYAVWARYPDFWREVAAVNHEVAALEPFLLHGRAWPEREGEGVCARLWTAADGRDWRLLLVRLDETPGARTVACRLPAELGGGTLRTTLGPGGAAVLPERAASLRLAPDLLWGQADEVLHEEPGRVLAYAGDAAGRLRRPLAANYDSDRAVTRIAVPAWTPVRLFATPPAPEPQSWRVSGPSAALAPGDLLGPVFRFFPGGRCPIAIDFPGQPGARLEPLAWEGRESELDGLAATLSCRTAALSGGSRYLLEWHPPLARDWQERHDYTLRLRLQASGEERVLRFRCEPPFAPDWEWQDDGSAILTLAPRFPAACYPQPMSLYLSGAPVQMRAAGAGFACRLAPEWWLPAGRSTNLWAEIAGPEGPLAATEVASLRWRDGLLQPGAERVARAPRLDRPPPFAGTFAELWQSGAAWPVTGDLFDPRQQRFVDADHRFQFAWDAQALYCRAELERPPGEIRARGHTDHGDFTGDDQLWFYLAAPGNGVAALAVNPNGARQESRRSPDRQPVPGWRSGAQVRTERWERGWRLCLAWPWESLGAAPPPAGQTLGLGLILATSVAPRERAYWRLPAAANAPPFGQLLLEP